MTTKTPRCGFRRLVALLALAAAPLAQAWTDKPVRMLVPAPAGGTMDVVARLLADQLSADIGQPVIVDNKAGAGGSIAVQNLLASPADGQTIMVTASNVLTEIPHVLKLPYDTLKDVRPIAVAARAGMVLVAGPAVPVTDVKGLVAYGKAHPGTLSFASYSTGTSSHYAGMIFNQKAGLDFAHVPFTGSPPGLQQLMGGQIAIMFDGIATSLPLIKAGKLKALGVASKARSRHLPDVPTMAELGYPEIEASNWIGVIAASAVPDAMADRIQAAVAKAAASPKVRERLEAVGFEVPAPQTSAQLAQSMRADYERNAGIVKAFDIKLN